MTQELRGKVALVTGASKGIGAEIARQLAAAGAAVVVNYATSKADADQVVAEIVKQGGRAVAVQGDVSKRDDIVKLFAEARRNFERVDVLVNNAGVYDLQPLSEVTEEHFHKQFNLNVLGLLLATREAVEQFGAAGGSIINISSSITRMLPPNSSVYTASKAAVDAITVTLAKELGPKIRVNAVNPGLVETEGVHATGIAGSDFFTMVQTQSPMRRVGRPADIAALTVYLASDKSSYITGETMHVSGGLR